MSLKLRLQNKMEYIFGLVGFILAVFFLALAIIYYGDIYNPITMTVSSLGNGTGKSFFSIGFIIAGCLGIPFYIKLERTLKGINETIRRMATGVSIVSCVAIALVGVVPDETFPNSFSIFHGFCAFISFVGTSAYIVLYSYLMLRHKEYGKLIPLLGLCVFLSLFSFILCFNPFHEWMLTVFIFIWILVVLIKKLRYEQNGGNR